jgi:hypothetical protein
MEGRMMLSASGLDVAPPTLDITQYTVTPIELRFAAEHVSLTTQPIDGGYINSNAVFTLSDGMYANSEGVFTSYPRIGEVSSVLTAVSDYHGTSVAGIQQFYGVAGRDVNLLPPWQLNTEYDSDGLQPAVIVSQTNGSGLAPDLKPIVIGPNPSVPGGSEGGSIPIHAIFADFRKDSQLASGVKAVATPAVELSIESLASARQLSTPDNALSGEWARAMVFEIAGGEPTAGDLHSLDGQRGKTSDNDDTLQHAEPLSSVEASQQNLKLASVRHAASSQAEGAGAGGMTQAQTEQQSRQLATVVMQLLDSGRLAAGFSVPASASQFSAGNLPGTENPDPAALASAAVFDQLGKENAAMIESSVEGKSWLRSIGVSPLLMVLALERIAALNSRRAAHEERIAAAKKPLRLRG